MKTHNIDLNKKHFTEAMEVLKTHQKEIEKSGDTILVLQDETRILVIYRMNTYLFQYLDRLI
ncbi:MAG: hypothetical protein Q4D77_00425 [Peptostreptococcaceae bacterium]|nr:hypothetical protein [Peptostreptococcaceae bacterium]